MVRSFVLACMRGLDFAEAARTSDAQTGTSLLDGKVHTGPVIVLVLARCSRPRSFLDQPRAHFPRYPSYQRRSRPCSERSKRLSSQIPTLKHRKHRCSERIGWMSSHFDSIVAAFHPLETSDSAVEAAGTTASNETPRRQHSLSATPAWNIIGNTMSCGAQGAFVCTENGRIQGRRNHRQTNRRRSTIRSTTRGQQTQRKHSLEPASNS